MQLGQHVVLSLPQDSFAAVHHASSSPMRPMAASLNLPLTGEMIYCLDFPCGFYPAQATSSAPPLADDPTASAPAGGDRGCGCAGAGARTEA